jgi:cobalt-zinc-cadmium resistance protein CzcA
MFLKSKVAQPELQSWEQKANEEQKGTVCKPKKNELAKYQEAINYYHQYGKKLSMKSSKWGTLVINMVKLISFNTFKV